VRVVEAALTAEEKPATAADLAKRFARAQPADVAEILDTLVTLGRAHPGDTPGTFLR
jgi:chromosome segregation and condensation protein ScpB